MTVRRHRSKAKETAAVEAPRDIVNPPTDEALTEALEQSFPASDPVNFAGSIAGRPPIAPPIGTHPLSGAQVDDVDSEAKEPKRHEPGEPDDDRNER